MVKRVYVFRGKYALVDDGDAERVSCVDWFLVHSDETYYAQTGSTRIGKSQRLLHRMIANAKPGEIIDHINGDGLDCRRANLRKVTAQENAQNKFDGPRKFDHKDGGVSLTPFQKQPTGDDRWAKPSGRIRRLQRLNRASKRAAEKRKLGIA